MFPCQQYLSVFFEAECQVQQLDFWGVWIDSSVKSMLKWGAAKGKGTLVVVMVTGSVPDAMVKSWAGGEKKDSGKGKGPSHGVKAWIHMRQFAPEESSNLH